VFEWVTDQLGSQGTVCGGGRYDPLIEMFGGKPTPACGFAIGVERLLELLKANGEQYTPNQCDVYIVHQGEDAQLQAFVVAERLRDSGLDVVLHCASASGGGSFKAQMKRADASGAGFAVIIGEDEVAKSVASVKNMRAEATDNNQVTVPLENVATYVLDQIVCGDECDDPTHHHH
jgi:histidyl-tRNA synthetase